MSYHQTHFANTNNQKPNSNQIQKQTTNSIPVNFTSTVLETNKTYIFGKDDKAFMTFFSDLLKGKEAKFPNQVHSWHNKHPDDFRNELWNLFNKFINRISDLQTQK